MDKLELLQLLHETFVAELDERMQALNHDLLELERRPGEAAREELMKTLFRSAHSLKGAAHAVNAETIETACHRLEDILCGVREGRLVPCPPLFALLFSAVDAIQEAGLRLRNGQPAGGGALAALLEPLAQAACGELPAMLETSAEVLGGEESVAAEAAPSAPQAASTIASSVRVAAEKLDALLAQSGELLVARRRTQSRVADAERLRDGVAEWRAAWRRLQRPIQQFLDAPAKTPEGRPNRLARRAAALLAETGTRLRTLEADVERLTRDMAADRRLLGQAGAALEHEVHRVRMLPFTGACRGLDRAVRDVARLSGKEVLLTIAGDDVEVDRSVLEALKDPLLHLVRNAVDHGIESSQQRRAAGKPLPAQVSVSAALRGSQVEIVVADDGRGLDYDAIRAKARQRGLPEARDERELAQLLFVPGFSTAAILTEVSGRGVGLDVVKSQIESLHGTVEIQSRPGQGTRFVLTAPLTLTTIAAVLVRCGGHVWALPGGSVNALVRFSPDQVRRAGGRDVLLLGDAPAAVVSLAERLGLSEESTGHVPAGEKQSSIGPQGLGHPGRYRTAVVLTAGERQAAFIVDEVLEQLDVVVQGLGPRIRRARLVSGATLLPSGRIALLLNAGPLVQDALSQSPARRLAEPVEAAARRPRLLVVEDSVTTRTLMKSILEAHGFDVVLAVDGEEAFGRLADAAPDLVVSDVDMPRLDGFSLTAAIRAAPRWRDLPVVLVTSRESDRDKARGVEAGANAYLVKSAFDQRSLLEVIGQLL